MSSWISNQVKTNTSFVSIKLLCHCSNLYTTITITITACSIWLFAILLTTTIVLFTGNFTQSWPNSYWLSSALSCPFIVQEDQSNERSWSSRFVHSASREFYVIACMCAFLYLSVPHACCCWFIWGGVRCIC